MLKLGWQLSVLCLHTGTRNLPRRHELLEGEVKTAKVLGNFSHHFFWIPSPTENCSQTLFGAQSLFPLYFWCQHHGKETENRHQCWPQTRKQPLVVTKWTRQSKALLNHTGDENHRLKG